MEKLRIEGAPTREEYIKINFYKLLRSRYIQLLLIIGGICLIIAIYKVSINAPDKYSNEIGYAIMFLILGPMLLYYRMLKTYNSSNTTPDDSIYEIDDESISYSSNSKSYNIKWKTLYKIEKIQKFIIIYESDIQPHIIPTNRLTNSDFNSLIKFITSNSRLWGTITKM
jgi:hypothetical protein